MGLRSAKIVCTLGPAVSGPGMIEGLVRAGMDVARLNFSHGTHESHTALIDGVREASERCGKPVPIVADLQGPKIRTGPLAGGTPVTLRPGQPFVLTTESVAGTAERVSTTYPKLHEEVRPGHRLLLDDGMIELRVLKVEGRDIVCEPLNGGELGENKGINLPGVELSVPAVTDKDKADLAFALSKGVDYIAVSFVRSPTDVETARQETLRHGGGALIIAKIEKKEAVEAMDEIIRASDGVMVARGDLGVEMSPEKLPPAQKRIISKARDLRLPVITATQMLASMTRNPRPTRAEASDVANAVFDGSSALMLSNETSVGRYPLESVEMMDRIIREAERVPREARRPRRLWRVDPPEAVCEAVCNAADVLPVKLIAAFTQSGTTARLVAHYRPRVPIVAFSTSPETLRRTALFWGVHPRRIGPVRDIDELAAAAEQRLIQEGLAVQGDVVGIVAGTPLGRRGTTNLLKLHTMGAE